MNWKIKPEKELLEHLVWKYSLVELSMFFGCSNKTVEKLCKDFSIELPPKGYWHQKDKKDSRNDRLECLFSLKEKIESPEKSCKKCCKNPYCAICYGCNSCSKKD